MPDVKKKFNNRSNPRNKKGKRNAPREQRKEVFNKEAWKPQTEIGRKVKSGEIKDIGYILDAGINILEAEIVDVLLPDLGSELILIGQSRGKFGGGQRRVFRQTQKKTSEGNKPKFSTFAIVGNSDGYVGVGYGKSKETVPAREKAIRNAKLDIMKIRRGCGSWQCGCKEPHTIPYKVQGKSGSVIIQLMPAPKGTGLCVGGEIAKILTFAGIKDVWSKTLGKTKTRLNLIHATIKALKNLIEVKTRAEDIETLGIIEGAIAKKEEPKKEDFVDVIEEIKEVKKETIKKPKAKKKENEKTEPKEESKK
jgi:small subunit ribosomal protein S5